MTSVQVYAAVMLYKVVTSVQVYTDDAAYGGDRCTGVH